jgi:hypothetical protein
MATCQAGCGETNLLNGSLGYCQTCYARDLRWRKRHKQRTCVTCGAGFTTTRIDAKFCSNACRQKAYRREHIPTAEVTV